jgi:hypothetical protein
VESTLLQLDDSGVDRAHLAEVLGLTVNAITQRIIRARRRTSVGRSCQAWARCSFMLRDAPQWPVDHLPQVASLPDRLNE